MTITGGWNDGGTVSGPKLRLNNLLPFLAGTSPLGVSGGVRMTDGTDLKVLVGTSGLSVRVSSGACIIPGTESANQACYSLVNDATFTINLAAASSSNPRSDRIIARATDTGTGTSTYTLEVVTGAPGPTAPLPTLPVTCTELAQVLVPANANLGTLSITDKRKTLQTLAPASTTVAPTWLWDNSFGVCSSTSWTGLLQTEDLTGTVPSLFGNFIAPSTGRVEISFGASLSNTNSSQGEVYAGVNLVGPGGYSFGPDLFSQIRLASQTRVLTGDNGTSLSREWYVTGLTPGATYTATMLYKVNHMASLFSGGYGGRSIFIKPSS